MPGECFVSGRSSSRVTFWYQKINIKPPCFTLPRVIALIFAVVAMLTDVKPQIIDSVLLIIDIYEIGYMFHSIQEKALHRQTNEKKRFLVVNMVLDGRSEF